MTAFQVKGYFETGVIRGGKDFALCRQCSDTTPEAARLVATTSGNTSGLHKHLLRHHKDVVEAFLDSGRSTVKVSTATPADTVSFAEEYLRARSTTEAAKDNIALAFCRLGWSWQQLDTPEFRGLPGLTVPPGFNRDSLSYHVQHLGKVVQNALDRRLNSTDVFVLIDGGTLVRK